MKKILTLVLATVLLVSVFALASCTEKKDDTVLTIGASATPHADILATVVNAMKDKGYTLKVVTYNDYVLPNKALNDGEIDANYFQHTPYLDSFNASNGTDLISAAKIHYEPFGIYGNGVTDLMSLAEGATIIIPADDSNETRALLLLAQEGLITLPADASAAKGVNTLDITDAHGFKVIAVEAETVPAQLANSDAGTIAVINGNYAISAGLNIADALATENASGDAAQTYANIIAVKKGNENDPRIKALIDCLKSDAVRQFIADTYKGAVVAIF